MLRDYDQTNAQRQSLSATRSERLLSAMKFVMSSYGTRGEVEPCVAVGRELVRRGHEVCMAVPRDLVGFVESAGLEAVAYQLDAQAVIRALRRLVEVLLFLPQPLEDPGGEQIAARTRRDRSPVLLGDEQDADVAGGRGRPATHRREFRAARCQRRRVLRHSVGHGALLPDAGQWPDPSDPAVAVAPPRNDDATSG